MLDACRLEARDRQRLAAERAVAASSYARRFWGELRKPEVAAIAVADAIGGLLVGGIAARLGGPKNP
jgi:hypothetical protein